VGAVLGGTAGWTDKTLIASGWYPGTRTSGRARTFKRFGYEYSSAELASWAPKIEAAI
jgi:hypothetical protein